MGGRILKLILFIEMLHFASSLPKNNIMEKLIQSNNDDTKIKLRNNKSTHLRQESNVETDSNIALNEMDTAKEDQNESSAAKEQNDLSESETDLQDKSNPIQDEHVSHEVENIQGTLSMSDNNENEQNLVELDDDNKTKIEEGAANVNNVNDEFNGNYEEQSISIPDDYIDTQKASEKIVETGDPNLNRFKVDGEEPKRSLLTGDTFTPSEMLPITTRLIAKVETPGSGKGIVSSATNPRELADRLFEAFFLTNKRIVTLKDFDISGLDALQALALSGEPADLRSASHFVTKAPEATLNFQDQLIGYDMAPRQSHYKLITKKIKSGHKSIKRGNRRRVIDLAKRLAKKRKLVLNSKRRLEQISTKKSNTPTRTKSKSIAKEITNADFQKKKEKTKVHVNRNKNRIQVSEKIKSTKNVNKATTTTKPSCRWRYECANLADLDTCQLHTECAKEENNNNKFIPVKHIEDEHSVTLREFRKMLGITFVDEEVEKILENRFVHLRPSNSDGIERIESLSEYFNKIIMTEYLGSTTPSWAPKKKRDKKLRLSESGNDNSS